MEHFEASEFKKLDSLQAAERVARLIAEGAASVVDTEDWLVDRLAPPFLEISELIRYTNNFPGTPNVLHIGMGDGTSNEHFKRYAGEHTSYAYSDRVYIDPRDSITAFIDKATGTSNDTNANVAAILRAELLIPASINSVTNGEGMEAKFIDFASKDTDIRAVRAKNLAEAAGHGRPASFGNLRTLKEILTEKPRLLLPTDPEFSRHISPLGTNLTEVDPIGKDSAQLLRDIANRPEAFFPRDPRAVSDIMFDRIRQILSRCDHIIRDDFKNVEKHFNPDSELRFHLIEDSRAGAFLHGDVYDFLNSLRKVLAEDGGLYVSDSVVSSYSYQFYYAELKDFLNQIPSDFEVEFYVKTKQPEELPPIYLAGIRMYHKNGSNKVQDLNTKEGYEIIKADELETNPQVLKQMAWTFIYRQIANFNNRQNFDHIDIDSIPTNVVDGLVQTVVNKFGQDLFVMATDNNKAGDVEAFIEKNCLPEIRHSQSRLLML